MRRKTYILIVLVLAAIIIAGAVLLDLQQSADRVVRDYCDQQYTLYSTEWQNCVQDRR